ncbi:MAG TPA: hypothetical protein PK510_02890, partial [Ottowia sp.]|nr:hypothetical protein [Ottowia sp.]
MTEGDIRMAPIEAQSGAVVALRRAFATMGGDFLVFLAVMQGLVLAFPPPPPRRHTVSSWEAPSGR